MAVFGGIFGRKDKKVGQSGSPDPASSSSPSSPTTLRKPNPLQQHSKSPASSSSSSNPRRVPSRSSLSAERSLADAGNRRRQGNEHGDDDEQDAKSATHTLEVGEYVLPPIDTPSLMNGMAEQSDYFASALSAISLIGSPGSGSGSSSKPQRPTLLPSLLKKTSSNEDEDEDNRPLGVPRPPPKSSASKHKRNSSSSDTLNPHIPPPRTDSPATTRSLPSAFSTKDSPVVPKRTPLGAMLSPRPNPNNLLNSPRPSSPTAASSSSHLPISPLSARPTSPLSMSSHTTTTTSSRPSKLTRPPLVSIGSREPLKLSTDPESKTKSNKTKADAKGKKDNGGGMFSFIRDRKKSTATQASLPTSTATEADPGVQATTRTSMSSSKSEKSQLHARLGSESPLPPVPSLPSSESMPLPPLRPIPVGEADYTRPSATKGFVPPVRRQRLTPANSSNTAPPTSPAATTTSSPPPPAPPDKDKEKDKEGTFELVAFRHVRAVSPGPTGALGTPRPVSPGPFQGLELENESRNVRSRSRAGSIESNVSTTRTTVGAFRAAQQRRGTTNSVASDLRKSAVDLTPDPNATDDAPRRPSFTMDRTVVSEGGASSRRPSMNLDRAAGESQQYLPLPGPPPPPPVDLPAPIRPFANESKPGSRRGSFDTASRSAAPSPRPPPSTSPTKTKSTYGQLFSASTTDEDSDSDEDDDESDDDQPLGVRKGHGPGRKTTITGPRKSSEFGELTSSPKSSLSIPKSTTTTKGSVATSTSSATITPTNVGACPRPKRDGVVNPPPRSSSLVVDALVRSKDSDADSSQPPSARAMSMFSDLANYATSKASKSLGAVNSITIPSFERSPAPMQTAPRLPPPKKAKDSDSDSSEEDEEDESSEDDDDAPLGLIVRPTSALSMRSHVRDERSPQRQPQPGPRSMSRSELGHGAMSPVPPTPKSALKKSSVPSTPASASSFSSSPAPPRPQRRPPGPNAAHSAPQAHQRHSRKGSGSTVNANIANNSRSMDSLPPPTLFPAPPMRPFAGGMYTSSPNGSSNGDSYSTSSGRLPLTPRDGSEAGTTTTSGSSAKDGPKPHARKGSVTFEEPANPKSGGVLSNQQQEARRRERRRSEAKNAIQIGNAINGPPPKVSDDEDSAIKPLFPMQTGGALPNMPMNMNMNMGMMNAWDPQLLMMLQTQQAMRADPSFFNAHQQAMLFAKQAYQLTVAQQAMEAAGDEWERSSNVNGPASGSVYGGGANPMLGMGMGGMSQMNMNMGMPFNPMMMNMNMMPMMFPPAPPSVAPSSVYAATTAGSTYGGGGTRRNVAFPSSASVAGDPEPSRTRGAKPRARTTTAPSNRNLPAQHRGVGAPPSSWRNQ